MRYLFLLLIAWIPSTVLGTSWIILPKGYEEWSGPYGFVVDAENRPHMIVLNWRLKASHEYGLGEGSDGEEEVPEYRYAVRIDGEWVMAPLPLSGEETLGHELITDSGGKRVWLVQLSNRGTVHVWQWLDGDFQQNAVVEGLIEKDGLDEKGDGPDLVHLSSVADHDTIWIGVLDARSQVLRIAAISGESVKSVEEPLNSAQEAEGLGEWQETLHGLKLQRTPKGKPIIQLFASSRPALWAEEHGGEWVVKAVDQIAPEASMISTSYQSSFVVTETGITAAAAYALELRFFRSDGDDWNSGTLDQFIGGPLVRMALDQEERPWILYGSNEGGIRERPLAVATEEDGQWEFMDVTPSAQGGEALVIAPDGRPWIAFSDLDAVYCAELQGSEWRRELVIGGGLGGGPVSDLRLLKDGTIQALVRTKEGLSHISHRDENWQVEMIDPVGFGGWFTKDDPYEGNVSKQVVTYWQLSAGNYRLANALPLHQGWVSQPLGLATNNRRNWMFSDAEAAIEGDTGQISFLEDWDQRFRPMTQRGGAFDLIQEAHPEARVIAFESSWEYSYAAVRLKDQLWVSWREDGVQAPAHAEQLRITKAKRIETAERVSCADIIVDPHLDWLVAWIEADGQIKTESIHSRTGETAYQELGALPEDGVTALSISALETSMGLIAVTEEEVQETHEIVMRLWYEGDEGWKNEVVAKTVGFGADPVVRVGDDGQIYLAYYDPYRLASVLAIRAVDGTWTYEDMPTRGAWLDGGRQP